MLVAMATHHATKQAAAIAVETATATIGMEPGPLTPVSICYYGNPDMDGTGTPNTCEYLLLWKP